MKRLVAISNGSHVDGIPMAVQPAVLAIIGPTAGGKSALAMAVAERLDGEILSVDSMQVYRGMDLGTAKPSFAERGAVRHHLIDQVEADETFTAARFVETADGVIAEAGARGVPLIAAGGTPMYFKALFHGLFEGPGADEAVRERLRAETGEALHRRLGEVDPEAALRIHANDQRRLIRALEVFELTGRPISELQTTWEAPLDRHPAVWVGLTWDRSELNRRINLRVRQMVEAGWIEETRRLMERFGGLSATAAEATGYRLWIDHLGGRIGRDDAIEQIKIATRRLASKQIKWFRRFPDVHWLDGAAPVETNAEAVIALWRTARGEG